MHIKRYEGVDMRDALRQVREELGPDALVLSTRNINRRGGLFGGFGRSIVEITAAVDRDVRRGKPTVEAGMGAGIEAEADRRVKPDASWNELRLTRALMQPLEVEIAQLRSSVERMRFTSDVSTTADLCDEISALRRATLDFDGSRRRYREDSPETAALRQAGIAERHHQAMIGGDPNQQIDRLEKLLDGALQPPRLESDAVTLYVGPTGVGKTTTLAKVASRTEACRQDLVILSTDVDRLAGASPLKAWSKKQGIEFEAASSPANIADRLSRLGKRPVLVDTAGRSPRDETGLIELDALRDALGARARVCLVLPATRKESDLRSDLGRFAFLSPDAMAITRVDESRDLGNVANLLLDGDCPPLQWITTGQSVPDDLDVADPRDLAHRILGAAA